MQQSKINSLIDYHSIDDDRLVQYINYSKYNDNGKWISLEELFCEKDFDFIDILFLKLVGKRPVPTERRLFLKTLMLLSLGTGCHPPSVMVPKLVASTTKNKEFAIINGLISGLATIGTHHLGAVVGMMKILIQLKERTVCRDIKEVVEEYVNLELSRGKKISGFGHPVYKKDPRPAMLFKEIRNMCRSNIYVRIYNELVEIIFEKKKIHPNIDAVLALSYLVLGFEPEHGIYLSFLSRSLSMVCHILEEFPKKPFSFLNEMVSIEDFYSRLLDSEGLNIEIKKMEKGEYLVEKERVMVNVLEVS